VFDAAVVSALYGDYDTLKPALPQDGVDVDWVLVTDDQTLRGGALGWRTVYAPRPGAHPNRAAKHPKLFPWWYTDAESSVWVDASFRVVSPDFVTQALSCADPIAQFVHPWRDCVYTEALASKDLVKYAGEDFASQVKGYGEGGHPEHWGLWATGVIARQHGDVRVLNASDRWASLIHHGTFQDQVSQPVALRQSGLRPSPFPGTHFANDWVRYEGSGNH
jgi:hypothetical protein